MVRRSRIDKDYYDSISSAIDSFGTRSAVGGLRSAVGAISKFESEEDYNQQMKALQDYEAMMSYDTDKARREIAGLEIKRDKILAEDAGRFAPVSYTDNGLPVFNPFRANASTEALDKEISQKRAYLNQAERLQEGVRLGSVGNKDSENYDEEYDYYANQRNFGIPTAEDLNTYDKMMDQTTWRTDSEGRLFDAYGKEVDPNKRDEQGRIIHPNQDKYDTTDKLGIFLSADAGEIEDAASRYVTTGATWDTILGEGKEKNWDQMDENEISNYYYYLNKFGEEAANDYLSSIQESLNQRKGFERAKAMKDNVALELLFGVEAGFDQFSSGITGVRNAVLGEDDYVPVTSTQFASQKVREDLADADLPVWYNFKTGKWESKILGSSVGQTAYDTITTTSNMLPSILTSTAVGLINPTAGAAVGTGLMGASAAGNAYTEMINLGYDVGQARTYAALVGGSEIALESLLGGISKLGGGAATKGITKLLGKADNAFAKFAIKFGNTPVGKVLINALEEGSEEYWQSILEPIFQNAILGTENEIDLFSEEALYSALLGAITGGVFEGADVGTQRAVQNYNTDLIGKEISRTEGGVDALKALAMDVAGANTKLAKQAGKVSSEAATGTGFGKVTAALKNSANQKKVGKLYQSVQRQVNKSNVSDIAAALESKGYTKQNAKNIADAVVAQMFGKELDAFQANVLKAYGSKELGETINELLSDDNSSIVKRTTDTSAFDVGIALGKGIAPASTQEVNSTEMKVSEDGKTKDSSGNEIPIKFADNGQIATESGNVGVEDVEFASHREAYIVESISALNLPAKAANTLFESINVKGMTDTQATDFVTGIQKAYELGRENNLAELPTHPLTKNLTSQQRMEAYSAGLGVRNKETAARQKAAASRKADKAKKGGVYFRGNDQQVSSIDSVLIRRKGSLDAKQVSGINTMKYLSKAIGTEFYVFESYKKDGAQYFVDEDGVEKKAPNGWYDPTTGRIYIDLNAGQTARGTMLFTVAHELTHFIRQNSPAKFDALADIVVNKSNLKGKVSERIEQKLKEAKDRGEPISRDTAYEEVIADSMETILTSGRVLEMMNEVKKQDKTLWEQIRDWFMDFIKSIREAYSGVDADTVEGQAIAEMDDVLKELEQVFAEGLVDAGENFQTAEKNTTEGGEVLYKKRKQNKMEDKYFARQIDQWDGEDHGGSFRVCSPSDALLAVGIPDVDIWFDQSKASKQLKGKVEVDKAVLKAIPKILQNPTVIAESYDNSVVIFGKLHDKFGHPIVIALRVNSTSRRNHITLVNKVRSVGTRNNNLDKLLAESAILYLNENKKETNQWFNALGRSTPFGGTKFGLIRSITFDLPGVNPKTEEFPNISADEKTESVAPAILKSERIDTDGNKLSEDQQAYFADSKVRDAEGKLQVMYRGDSADVNVFDRKKSRPSNLYGRGFYFTSSKSHAGQYGDARAFYLNIKNPLRPNQNSITREQMLKFLKAIEDDGEDYDLYNYGENATASSVLRSVWGKGDFEMLQDVSASAIGDLVAAVELFNSINGTDYDGLILPTETVIFQSEQAKLTSNKTPTSNPDIRYSYRGKNQDGIEVYETSEEVKKLSYKERQKQFLDIMSNEYRGRTAKFIRNGHAYYATFDEKDINKNIYGDKESNEMGWKAKINVGADGNIFELVENAQYDRSKPERGKTTPAHRGVGYWDYFIKNVQIDGRVFDLLANVRKKANGAFVYSIQLNENKKIKASPPLGSLLRASNGVPNASNTRVTQPHQIVNNNNSKLNSNRTTESLSTRSILTNALEGVAQNEWEQNKLNEYKENIAKVEEMEYRLQEINSQLYPYGKKMPPKERIALQDEAVGLRNKITNIDKKLLRLEATKPLQNVLNRERARVRREMKQKAEERISEVKAEAAQRLKRRSEGHAATEMRKKIRKTIRELDKILNRGDKKRNVKEDMKDFVTKATKSAELLFKESYPNDDILREGFQRVNLRPSEQVHYDEARKIMEQIQTLGTSVLVHIVHIAMRRLQQNWKCILL